MFFSDHLMSILLSNCLSRGCFPCESVSISGNTPISAKVQLLSDNFSSVICFCQVPQQHGIVYLRRLIPMHEDLRLAGTLPPVDAPHHMRADEWRRYREGAVISNRFKGSVVDIGLSKVCNSLQLESRSETCKNINVVLTFGQILTKAFACLKQERSKQPGTPTPFVLCQISHHLSKWKSH